MALLSAKSLGNKFRYLMGGDREDEILSRWQTGGKSIISLFIDTATFSNLIGVK